MKHDPEAVAKGVAMIDAGITYEVASAAVRVPMSSLCRYYHQLGRPGEKEKIREARDRVAQHYAVLLETGAEQLVEQVASGTLKGRDLHAVLRGIAEVLGRWESWEEQRDPNRGGNVLERLLLGSSRLRAYIEVTDAEQQHG